MFYAKRHLRLDLLEQLLQVGSFYLQRALRKRNAIAVIALGGGPCLIRGIRCLERGVGFARSQTNFWTARTSVEV